MLRLKVAAPEYLIIELIVVLLQKLDGLRIGYVAKLRIQHMV